MARQRPSSQKRQREFQKRQRELRKAEKAAQKRERRLSGEVPASADLFAADAPATDANVDQAAGAAGADAPPQPDQASPETG